MSLARIELTSRASEARILSVELQGHFTGQGGNILPCPVVNVASKFYYWGPLNYEGASKTYHKRLIFCIAAITVSEAMNDHLTEREALRLARGAQSAGDVDAAQTAKAANGFYQATRKQNRDAGNTARRLAEAKNTMRRILSGTSGILVETSTSRRLRDAKNAARRRDRARVSQLQIR